MALPTPDGVDLLDDRRPTLIAVSVVAYVLALLGISLRLASRRIKGLPLWLDDWLAIAALIPALGNIIAIAAYGTSHGIGQHVWAAPPTASYAWQLALFASILCYTVTLVLVKLSILAFYWKTFSVNASTRPLILALTFMTCGWGIAIIITNCLQCQPISALWDRYRPNNPPSPADYECNVNTRGLFIASAIPNIMVDILLMALPMPYIWRLRLPRRQKVAVGGIFAVGIFVTITSVLRLAMVINIDRSSVDVTWNYTDAGIWTIVEGNVAILCACLVFLKPVINRLSFGLLGTTTPPNEADSAGRQKPAWRNVSGQGSSQARSDGGQHPFTRLDEPDQPGRKSWIELQDVAQEVRNG
ncbi:hypothetical protein B0I35DRAFT_481875 [Stachybotrys elegans]|uniref:Rhodopsin domain-containing protein n=1 Tax=Stachybotrys elegans TaxID=80388 RepID=A0A8K0SK92_9HYPO|nr:hypothetical protein B0I35DRAFT_481875 [Stachybotrys elegans]